MITHSIAEYISRNQERKLVRSRRKGIHFEYYIGRRWVDQKTFDQMFPEYEYRKFNNKGVNPDKKKIV